MNIRLIYPTFYTPEGRLFQPPRALVPPLSVLLLAALVPPPHRVAITDETVEPVDFESPADLVGITTTSINVRRAYELADQYRRRGVPVVLGGIHASVRPDEAGAHADSLVLGEAEDAWPELLRDLESGALRPTYARPRRDSLAGLPQPRYDLIRPDRYLRPPFSRLPILPVQTARGCPHNCDFCSVTRFWGTHIRTRPIDEVVAEIRASGGRTFLFTDDNFFARPARTLALCEALAPLRIRFLCQIDTTLHRKHELIRAAARAGCFMAFVGMESLNPVSLAHYNKRFNKPEEYARLIRALRARRIAVFASLMFGLADDTPDTVDTTVAFLIRNRVDLAAFFRLTPLPGTALYERLAAAGHLEDPQWWLHLGTGLRTLIRYDRPGPASDVLVKRANRRFFSWPSMARRLAGFPPRFVPLLLNMSARRKAIHSEGSCSL